MDFDNFAWTPIQYRKVVMMAEGDRTPGTPGSSGAQLTGTRRLTFGPSFRIFLGNTITLELPAEISAILSELMNQTKHEPEELFIRSLLLYKAAVDAEEAGKTLAILDSEGEIDQEITNL